MEQAFEICPRVQNEDRLRQCAQDVAGTGDPIFANTFVEAEKVEANTHPEPLGLVDPKDFSIAQATVTFQWERSFDKDQDVVLYRHCVWDVNSIFTFRACDSKPTQELSKTVTLESGRDYFWKVIAEDGRGGSTESKTWRLTAK